MSKQASIKDQLKDYLKNPQKNRTTVTVEVVRGKQTVISDNNRYHFVSKNLEKLLKNDKVDSKKLYLKLKKWNFSQDIQNYSVVKKKADNLEQKGKNLLEYQEIMNLMNQDKSKAKNTPLKKSAKPTPAKSIRSSKQTPRKQKIQKKTSDAEKVEKSLKSKKQTPRKSVKKQIQNKQRLTVQGYSSKNIYTPKELIFAQYLNLNKRPASVSVTRKLTGAKEFKDLNNNFEQQFLMSKRENQNYDKELQKTRQTSNVKIIDDKIPKSLKNMPITYAEILHGIQKGMISWEEINLNYQVISKILV